ncbi:calmodulin-binding transcription activator 2-like isoform X3 [Tripterygium wilfordii]|uniref:Calmodulin-binding transcription activator 2-like isoform X3 n=1 Tax=Tripterygium wilfordii TaxID=458696 RepID=A0A7J7CH12_TRIWF|nr:calmodulin-binding transcription activator 2-like isoform X2 [Tripterygium wilfordii]KAF5733342.1 calmodulin-binding transcription activator 2-like isoform X3 [Tripterygium wilfordii]
MADRGSYGIGPRLDTQQLQLEAQHRWLRPAEICEILRNFQKFHISSEPPNRPPSGSLFLFDRKVLRYFRKDGHIWRKKKDGKTVKEAHEKLKVGSVDVLHCYYAHGEENENFQRRSYWMLEQELMHIVFVHYLEVKGNRANGSPLNFSFQQNHSHEPSVNTDSTSPTSTLSSLCEDADSEDIHQASSRCHSYPESLQMQKSTMMDTINADLRHSSAMHPSSGAVARRVDGPRNNDGGTQIMESQNLASWEDIFEQCTKGYDNLPSHVNVSSNQAGSMGVMLEEESVLFGELLAGGAAVRSMPSESSWQIPFESGSMHFPGHSMDPQSNLELGYDFDTSIFEQGPHLANMQNILEPFYNCSAQENEQALQKQLVDAEAIATKSNSKNDMTLEGNINYSLIVKQSLLDREEGLKKVDSFSRWVDKELVEVDDLQMQSSSGITWSTVECGDVVDESSMSPSLSQDQLFSIADFSPKWSYTDSESEVLITGTFLRRQEGAKYSWSCMFGEVEVPAEVLGDGILCCHAPPHKDGRVPLYVTCSNRFACSEVREFDFCLGSAKDVDVTDIYGGSTDEMLLHMQLVRLLSLRSTSSPNNLFEDAREKQNLIGKLMLLRDEEESYPMVERVSQKDLSQHNVKEHLFQWLTKEKLYSWLFHKVIEGGKGPSVLDVDGQGTLHLAAALGYDWAIKPTVTAGVSINFRDANGWTALHWAAFCGREQTVAVLVSLGAAPGALTDPSPEFPLGRPPADLASGNGHKGISGFLAEVSLTSYLSSLTMNDPKEDGAQEVSGTKAVQTVSERTATPVNYGDVLDVLSLKDSLTAVCNATQAANRIHQVFRLQSFQRKQITEYEDDEFGLSDELALSVVAAKSRKPDGMAHSAAIHIQKKFRGWKKRKEFLIIRQRIVKIQAHVRGHQVRKQYRAITWSVGILEKVILRWRRKGSGLRGFRRDVIPDPPCLPSKEDDYDFLKEGRKQTEERLQKALTRVKSMVQYPEGRAQYRRLLTVVEGFRESKVSDMVLTNSEGTADDEEDLVNIDSLLDDDNFMSIAFD